MNENENTNPLFPENEETANNANDSDISFFNEDSYSPQEPQEFEPIKEVPTQDFPVFNEEAAEPQPEIPEEAVPFSEPEIKEAPVNTEAPFNPYAPKPEDKSNPFFYNESRPASSGSTQSTFHTEGPAVNPSYNQPINQNYSSNNGSYNYNPNNPGNFSPYQQPPVPKDNKNGKLIATVIVAVCVIVGLIALVSSFLSDKPDTNATSPSDSISTTSGSVQKSTTASILPTTQATTSAVQSNSIWVAEKVRPVVVGVLAYQQGSLAGEGSGVLMSEDTSKNCTYVITCAHVINEPGCDFSILLLDGSLYDAEIVALDERTDIGVLKVNKTGLPLAEFGDSSSLKIGEPIYAIGNPGGSEYFGSITNGIVSAIDRSISATYTMTCIQHNAAINPGNSGGALVNSAGQIIGINSSKIAKTDYEGMGFAVPSAIFKPVVEALIQYGYVPNRPELGIKYASVSDYKLYSIIVSIKGLPRESIIIAEIPEGSALSGTEAQVGDLIIAVNGKKMDTSNVLLDMIDTGAVGDTLTLTLCRVKERSYETSTFDVTVQLVEDKGSITTTTQAATLPQQDGYYSDFGDFFDFFGW